MICYLHTGCDCQVRGSGLLWRMANEIEVNRNAFPSSDFAARAAGTIQALAEECQVKEERLAAMAAEVGVA